MFEILPFVDQDRARTKISRSFSLFSLTQNLNFITIEMVKGDELIEEDSHNVWFAGEFLYFGIFGKYPFSKEKSSAFEQFQRIIDLKYDKFVLENAINEDREKELLRKKEYSSKEIMFDYEETGEVDKKGKEPKPLLSTELKDLFQKIFQKKKDRIDFEGILSHPWVKDYRDEGTMGFIEHFDFFKRANRYFSSSQTRMMIIEKILDTGCLSPSKYFPISMIFTEIDSKSTGKLSVEELESYTKSQSSSGQLCMFYRILEERRLKELTHLETVAILYDFETEFSMPEVLSFLNRVGCFRNRSQKKENVLEKSLDSDSFHYYLRSYDEELKVWKDLSPKDVLRILRFEILEQN